MGLEKAIGRRRMDGRGHEALRPGRRLREDMLSRIEAGQVEDGISVVTLTDKYLGRPARTQQLNERF